METKLSVVIPVYNGGTLLFRTLDSLCSQTFRNFEIIVVDDGSTDDTAQKLARYAEKEPRLHCFTIPNGGPARARNFGVEQAQGEYLYFCDADDLPEPCLLEKMTAEMDSGVQLAACGYIEEHEKDGVIRSSVPRTLDSIRCETKEEFLKALPRLMQEQLMYVNWNKMYRLDMIRREHIIFPEQYASCEDRLFNIGYYAHVDRFSFLSEPMFHYYMRGEASLVSKFLPTKYESLVRFDSALTALYEKNGMLTEDVRKANARFFMKGVVACLISLHHPSCKWSQTEKKGWIREILMSESLDCALTWLDGGIQYKVIGAVLRTKSPALAGMLGGMASFGVKRLPGLLQKIKRRS